MTTAIILGDAAPSQIDFHFLNHDDPASSNGRLSNLREGRMREGAPHETWARRELKVKLQRAISQVKEVAASLATPGEA